MDNNIENRIKTEFQKRVLTPSTNSWDLLDAKLDLVSSKRRTKKLVFLSYAAVFIGLLFGLLLFFNTNKTSNKINRGTIVDNKDEVIKPIDDLEIEPIKSDLVVNKRNLKKNSQLSSKGKKVVHPEKVLNNKPLNSISENSVTSVKKAVLVKKISALPKSNRVAMNIVNEKEILRSTSNTNTVLNIGKQTSTQNLHTLAQATLIKKLKENTITNKIKMHSTNAEIDAMLAKEMLAYTRDFSKEFSLKEDVLLENIVNDDDKEFQFRDKIKELFIAGVDTVDEFVTNNN